LSFVHRGPNDFAGEFAGFHSSNIEEAVTTATRAQRGVWIEASSLRVLGALCVQSVLETLKCTNPPNRSSQAFVRRQNKRVFRGYCFLKIRAAFPGIP
jgi:hypothetical protein